MDNWTPTPEQKAYLSKIFAIDLQLGEWAERKLRQGYSTDWVVITLGAAAQR